MRTRRANHAKSYVTQTYDLGDGSEAEELQERLIVPQDNEAEDEDFAAPERGDSPEDDSQTEDADDKALELSSDADSSSSETAAIHRYLRYRRHGSKGERPAWLREPEQYLSINPAPTDSHVPRGYAGYFDRNVRGPGLVKAWFGPDMGRLRIAAGLLNRWMEWSLLPPKEFAPKPDQHRKGIWSKDAFEKEHSFVEKWLQRVYTERPRGISLSPMSFAEAQPYCMESNSMPVLVGPSGSQVEVVISTGQGIPLSETGLPLSPDDSQDEGSTGWMIDVGGIVASLDWVPRRSHQVQLLAMAVIPFSDQHDQSDAHRVLEPETQGHGHGVIQIWEFSSVKSEQNIYLPSISSPKVRKTIFTDQSRVRRIKWNPACNHLAILSRSGVVWVVDFDDDELSGAEYERLNTPLATLSLVDEVDIKATCMTWVNVNRLVIGYSDGTTALWSIHPQGLISRHATHHAPVIDVVSGYPTVPYLVASTPMGGHSKLVDMRAPTYETTDVPTLAVNLAPSQMCWSEHFLGFFTILPSSHVLNTIVSLLHHTAFPIARRVFTGERYISSLAVGRTHPFLLIATMEGSLWALNPQFELIHAKRMLTDRIKVFHHEHRPGTHFAQDSPARKRGAGRISQGFRPEQSLHARSADMIKRKEKAKAGLRKVGDDGIEKDDANAPGDPTKGVLDEPLSRITAIEWNPNEGWGSWAAVALGSGLVKIMDLGLDRKSTSNEANQV